MKSTTETNELQVAQDETLNSVFEGEPVISKDENFTKLSLQDYAATERTPIEKEMENEESQNDKLEEDDKEKGEIKTGDSSEVDASDSKERVEDQELPKASELSSEEMLAKTDALGSEEEKRETGNIGKAHETKSNDQEDASNLESIEKLQLEAGSAYIAAEETTTKEDEQESEKPEEDFDDKGQEANDIIPEREEEVGVKLLEISNLESTDSKHPVEGPTETRLDEFSKKSWSQRDEINDNAGEKEIIALQDQNKEVVDVTKTPATEMAKPEDIPSDSAPVQVLDESRESGEEVNKEDLDGVGEKEIQTDAPIEEDIENKKLDVSSSALGAEATSLHTEEIQNELTSIPLVTLPSGQTDKSEDTCQDCPREHESQRKKIDPSETTNEVVEQGVKLDEVEQENMYEKPITVPHTVPEECGANIRSETETPSHMIMVDKSDEVGGEMFGALETTNEVEDGATIDEAKTDLTHKKASTASKAVPEVQEVETRAENGTFTHKIMVENQSEKEAKEFSGLASQEQEFGTIKDQFSEEGQTRSINQETHSVIQTTDEPCLQKELWPQNITDHTYEEKLHSDKQDNVPVAEAQSKDKLNKDYSRNEPFTSKREEAESCDIALDALSTMEDPVNMNIQKTAAVSGVEMHNLEIMEEHKDPESIVVDEKINEATTWTSLQTDEKHSKVSDLNTNIEKEIFSDDANTRSDIYEKAEDPVEKSKESSEDGIGNKKLEGAAPQWKSEDQSDETYSANENIENDISNEKEEAKGDQKWEEKEVPLVEPENQNHGTNSVHAIASDELFNEEEDGRSIDRSEKTEIVDPKDNSKAGKNIDVLPVTPGSIEETMQEGARDKEDEASTCIPKEQIHYTIEENDKKTEESNINLEIEDQNYEVGGADETTRSGLTEEVETSDLLSKERSLELPSSPAEEVAVVRLNNEEPSKVADSSAVTSTLVAGRIQEQVSEKPRESTKCFSEEDIQETIKLEEENKNEGLERDYESATLRAPVEENTLKEDATPAACEEHNYEVIGTEESTESTTREEDQATYKETSRQNIATDGFLNQKAEAWEKDEEASFCVPEEQIHETVEANERIMFYAIKGNAESEAIQIHSIPALENQRNEPSTETENTRTDISNDPERLDITVCNLTPSEEPVDESKQRSEASLPETEECASKTIEVSESKENTNEPSLEMLESSLETDFIKDEQPEKVYKLDCEDISENMNAREVITEVGGVNKLIFCVQTKAAGESLNEKDTKFMEETPAIVPQDIASNEISNEEEDGRSNDPSEKTEIVDAKDESKACKNFDGLPVTPTSVQEPMQEEAREKDDEASSGVPKEQSHETLEANDKKTEQSNIKLEVEDQNYDVSGIAETTASGLTEKVNASDLLPKERNPELPSPLAEEVPVVRLNNEELNKVADGSAVTSTSVAERTNKQESEGHQETTKFFPKEDIQGTIKIEEENKIEKLARDSESTIEEHEKISVKKQSRIEIPADNRGFDDSILQASLKENTLKEGAAPAASEEHNYDVRGIEESKESTNWEEDQVTDEETSRENIAVDGQEEDVNSVDPSKKIENMGTKDDNNADKNIDAMDVTRTSIEEIVQGEEWKKDEESMQRSEASLHEAEEDASKTIEVSQSKEGTNELSLETFESSLQTEFPIVEQPEKVYKLDSEDKSENINAREVIKEEDGLKKLKLYIQSEPVGESLNLGDTKLVEETPEIGPLDIASNEISNEEVSEEIKAFGKAENIEEESNLTPDSAKGDLDEQSFRQSNDDNMTEESTIKLEVEDQTYEAKEVAETTTRQIEKEEANGDQKWEEEEVPLVEPENQNHGTNSAHAITSDELLNEEEDGRSIDRNEKTEIVDPKDDSKAGKNIDILPVTPGSIEETMQEGARDKDDEASTCIPKEQIHYTIEENDMKTEESNINLEIEDQNYEVSGADETTRSGLTEKVEASNLLSKERSLELPSSPAEETAVVRLNNEEPSKVADASAVTSTLVAGTGRIKEQVSEKPQESTNDFSDDIQETIKLEEENKNEGLERDYASATLRAPVEENILEEDATPAAYEEHNYEMIGTEKSKESTTREEDQAINEETSMQNIATDGFLNQKEDVHSVDSSKNMENVDTKDDNKAGMNINDLHVTPMSVEEIIQAEAWEKDEEASSYVPEEQIHETVEANERIMCYAIKGNAESEAIQIDSIPALENQRNEPSTEAENTRIDFSKDPECLDITVCNLTPPEVSVDESMQRSEAFLPETEECASKTIEVSESKETTNEPSLEMLESSLETEFIKDEQPEKVYKLDSEDISENMNASEVITEEGGVKKLIFCVQSKDAGESLNEKDTKLMEETPEIVPQDIASNEISNEEVSDEIRAFGTAEKLESKSNLKPNSIKDDLDEESFRQSNDDSMTEESIIKLEVEDQTYEASEIAETTSGQIEEEEAKGDHKLEGAVPLLDSEHENYGTNCVDDIATNEVSNEEEDGRSIDGREKTEIVDAKDDNNAGENIHALPVTCILVTETVLEEAAEKDGEASSCVRKEKSHETLEANDIKTEEPNINLEVEDQNYEASGTAETTGSGLSEKVYFLLKERNFELPSSSAEEVQVAKVNNEEPNKLADASAVTITSVAEMTEEQVSEKPHETTTFFSEEDTQETFKFDKENKTEKLERDSESASEEREQIIVKEHSRTEISEDDRCFDDSVAVVSTLQGPVEENVLKEEATPAASEEHNYEVIGIEESKENSTRKEDQATHEETSRQNIAMDGILNQKEDVNAADPSKNIENVDTKDEDNASTSIDDLHATPISIEETIEEEEQIHEPTEDNDRIRFDSFKGNTETEAIRRDSIPAQENQRNEPTTEIENAKIDFSNDPEGLDITDCNLTTSPVYIGEIMQKSEASLQEAEEYASKTIEVSESKEGTSMDDKGPRLETLESNLQTEVKKGEQPENVQKLYSEAMSEGINAKEVIKEEGGMEKLKLYCQNGTIGESFNEEDMKLMKETPEMVPQDIASNEISNEEVSEEIKASGTAENIEGKSNLNNLVKDYLDVQSFQESNDANMTEESTIKLEVEDRTYEASETSGQIEEDTASDLRIKERNCEQSISPTEEVEVVSLNNEDPNETGDASPFTSTSIAEKTKESLSEEHQQTTRFVSKEEIQESIKIKKDNESEKFGRDSEPVSEEHEKASGKEISIIEISKDEESFKDAVGVFSTLQTPVEDTMQKEKEKEAPAETEDHSYEVIEMTESKETATLEEDQATNKGPSRLSLETNLMEIEQLEKGCKMDSENKQDSDAREKKYEKIGIEESDVCLHKERTDEEHLEKPSTSSTMFEGLKPTDVCENMEKETKKEEDGTERLDTETIESRSTENKKEDAKLEQATVDQEQRYEISTELEHIKEPPSDQAFEGLKVDEIEENTEERTIEDDLEVKDLEYTFVENKLVDPSFQVDENKNQEQPTPEMQPEEQSNEVKASDLLPIEQELELTSSTTHIQVVSIKGDDDPCKSGDTSGVSNLSLEESTEQEVADKHQGIIKFEDEEQTQETIILKEEIQPEKLETQSISEELEIIAEKESTNNEISKNDKVSEITVDSSLTFQDSIQEKDAEGEKFISDHELGSEKQLEIKIEEKMLNEEEVANACLLQDQHEHLENPSYQVSKEIKISSLDEDIEKQTIKEGEDAHQVADPDLKPEDEKMREEVSKEIQVRSQNLENEIIEEEHAAKRPENVSSTYEKVEESFQEKESNTMEDAAFGLEIEKQSYKTDKEVSNEPKKVDTVKQAKEEENREEDFKATSIKDEMGDQKILHKEDQEILEETPQLGVEDQICEASDSNGVTENEESQEVMPSDIVSKEQCFEITKPTSETIETASLKDEQEPNKVTDISLATTKSTEEKAPEEVAEKNQEITKALNEEETREIINPVGEHESKKIERELEQVLESLEVTGENDNIANQIKEGEGSAKELEAVSGGEKVEESATRDEIKMLEAAIPEPEPEHQTYQTKFSKDTLENETSNEDDTEDSGGVVILEKHVIEGDAAKDLEASYVICEKVEENIQGDVSKKLEESPHAFEPKEYQSRDTEKESNGLEGVNDDENSDKKIIEEEFTPNELNSMSSGGDKVGESFQECETEPGLDDVDRHFETIDGSYTAENGLSNDVVSKGIEGTDDEKSEKQVLEEESTSKQQKSVTVEGEKDEENLQGEEATLELEVRDWSNKANDDDGTMNDTLNQVATYLNPVLIEQNVIKTGSEAIESSTERNNKYPDKELNATGITTVPEEEDKQKEVGRDVEGSPDSVHKMKSDEPIITAERNNHFASEETASSEELTEVHKLMIPPADPVLAHESTNSSDITEKMLPEEGEKKLPDASTTLLEQHCDNEKVNEIEAEKENPGLASIFEALHKEDKKLAEVSSLMASEKIQKSISNSKDEGTSDFISIKQETEEYKTQEDEQDGPKKPENISALVVDDEKQVKTNAPENAEISTVEVEEGTLKNVNSSSVKDVSIEGKKIQEALDLDPEVKFDKTNAANRDFQINTQNPDDKTKTNSAVADQIRQSLEVSSNFEGEKSKVESHDNLTEKQIQDAPDDQNEKGFESYSDKIRLSDLLEKSTRKTEVMTDNVMEEGNSDVKKGELENELGVEVHLEEEKTDGEEEEHKNDRESDTPVIVEASRDTNVKPSPKKSHNILSGVGSKVKHSIAKVKKAITGKSSHAKTTSPK